jgi:hypothetical protein
MFTIYPWIKIKIKVLIFPTIPRIQGDGGGTRVWDGVRTTKKE